MQHRKFLILLITAIVAFPLLACILLGQGRLELKPGVVSRADERLAQLANDGIFSGSALIAQDGAILLSKGYGLADRAQGVSNTPQTRFHLGSMTKQFTAMGILMLENQGKLSVQDPICKYFTNCPTAWQGITIHHLLTHTSGLSTRVSSRLYREIEGDTSSPVTEAEQPQYLGLTSEWPAGTQPGENYAYNNFGYILLGRIIEVASSQSYGDYLDQAIFTPLNMRDTGYPDGPSGMAKVYADRDDKSGAQFGMTAISDGSDNLYSTSEDLYLWDQALYTSQLLPQEKLDLMFTPFAHQSDLPGFDYGYGWFVAKILGRPIVLGTGGGPSFVTVYFSLPADGITLIVLTNQGATDFISNMVNIIVVIAGALLLSDLIFALSAIAFMLLLALLLAAQKDRRVKTTWVIGILWALLAAPFTLVFSRYLAEGRGVWTLLPLSLVLLFILTKALLDFVLRIDFRRNRMARLVYLALGCLALFSLVWIAFTIHPSWGIPVLVAFGILAVSVIFMYRKENDPMKKQLILTVLIVLATLALAACSLGTRRLNRADGAAYAAEVDEYVESYLVGQSECDFDKSFLGLDPEWKEELANDSAWQQKCEADSAKIGAYKSKMLDHVEDQQEYRVVIYHVVYENNPDVTLRMFFYNDDPDHLIVGIDFIE
jgi:CubicO group peptidase (beta-lactamase class C family)